MKSSSFTVVLILTFLAACNNNKQSDKTVSEGKTNTGNDTSENSVEMKRYWLVLLKKGENRNQDSAAPPKFRKGIWRILPGWVKKVN